MIIGKNCRSKGPSTAVGRETMEAKFLAQEVMNLGPQIGSREGSFLCQKRKESDKNSKIQKANRQRGERDKECMKLLLANPFINVYD